MNTFLYIFLIILVIILGSLVLLLCLRILHSLHDNYREGHNEDHNIFRGGSEKLLKPYEKFSDIDGEKEYEQYDTPSLHRGQCKLFLNEFQFLTNSLKNKDDEAVVIYAGACPSHHTWYLSTFFPNVKFVLIDPHICKLYVNKYMNTHLKYPSSPVEFSLFESKRGGEKDEGKIISYTYLRTNIKQIEGQKLYKEDISSEEYTDIILSTNFRFYFIQDYFSISLAERLKSLSLRADVFFMCDIRTHIFDIDVRDGDIIWNLSQQYNWVHILKPKNYMLKFRMPYHEKDDTSMSRLDEPDIKKLTGRDFAMSKSLGIDFVEDYKAKKLTYLNGVIYLQPWAKLFSTESRLVGIVSPPFDSKGGSVVLENKEYFSFETYERRFAYYNYQNAFSLFRNDYAGLFDGFDNCGNCALEALIFEEYFDKFRGLLGERAKDKSSLIAEWVRRLAEITGQFLNTKEHGKKLA